MTVTDAQDLSNSRFWKERPWTNRAKLGISRRGADLTGIASASTAGSFRAPVSDRARAGGSAALHPWKPCPQRGVAQSGRSPTPGRRDSLRHDNRNVRNLVFCRVFKVLHPKAWTGKD